MRERKRERKREIYNYLGNERKRSWWGVDTMGHVVHVICKAVNGWLPSFIHQFSFVRIIRKLKKNLYQIPSSSSSLLFCFFQEK